MAVSEPLPLSVFVRPPWPGQVKTRLGRAVGEARAARLYAAFVEDTLAHCRSLEGVEPVLWVAGDPDDPALLAIEAARGLPRLAQAGGDLGVRMAAALARSIGASGRGAVIGTDAPTLPAALLARAEASLRRADLVLGPSNDGGYVLLAARGRVPAVFDGVRWSTRHVLDDTLARARAAGLEVALLPPWYDVDDAADLRLLRTHLALSPSSAPATARALALKT